jgi:hypothetical protein
MTGNDNSIPLAGYDGGPLPSLAPVLEEWVGLMGEACERWEGDVPWRYLELASVGLFAGAVWRKGGFVIQEYSRHKNSKRISSTEYFGRGDIWFEFAQSEFDCEAKICFHDMSPTMQVSRSLIRGMKKAVQDAIRLKRYPGERCNCGLLISIPLVNIDNPQSGALLFERDKLRDQLRKWIAAVRNQGAACAWFVRQDLYGPLFPDSPRPNSLYPGTALLIMPVASQI